MAVNNEHLKAVIIIILTLGIIIGIISIIPKQKEPAKQGLASIRIELKKTNYAAGEEINGRLELDVQKISADYKINALIDGQTKGVLNLAEVVKSAGLSFETAENQIIMKEKIIIGLNTFGLAAPEDPGSHYMTIRLPDGKEETVQFYVE